MKNLNVKEKFESFAKEIKKQFRRQKTKKKDVREAIELSRQKE